MTATPMQRMDPDRMTPGLRQVRETLKELTGDATFVEVFAQAPELLDFVMTKFYGEIFFGGRVDERYKQLARLRLSQLHGCRTCNKQNVPGALEAGYTQAQLDAMDSPSPELFSEAELAVLEFAEQVALTRHEGKMDEALHARLSKHFDQAQICELGTVMAVISGMAKLSFVMQLVEREDYCPFAG